MLTLTLFRAPKGDLRYAGAAMAEADASVVGGEAD